MFGIPNIKPTNMKKTILIAVLVFTAIGVISYLLLPYITHTVGN